jgi:hypothetical protein
LRCHDSANHTETPQHTSARIINAFIIIVNINLFSHIMPGAKSLQTCRTLKVIKDSTTKVPNFHTIRHIQRTNQILMGIISLRIKLAIFLI